MRQKNSHCSYCGAPFDPQQPWPRTCRQCGNTSFLNPIPVVVVIVPVDGGVLLVRRAIEPRRGSLALPGGFVNLGETWQEAGAREVAEETGLAIDPSGLELLRLVSVPDGNLVIVALARPCTSADLLPFVPNEEASERVVAAAPVALAFDLHTKVVREFLGHPTH